MTEVYRVGMFGQLEPVEMYLQPWVSQDGYVTMSVKNLDGHEIWRGSIESDVTVYKIPCKYVHQNAREDSFGRAKGYTVHRVPGVASDAGPMIFRCSVCDFEQTSYSGELVVHGIRFAPVMANDHLTIKNERLAISPVPTAMIIWRRRAPSLKRIINRFGIKQGSQIDMTDVLPFSNLKLMVLQVR